MNRPGAACRQEVQGVVQQKSGARVVLVMGSWSQASSYTRTILYQSWDSCFVKVKSRVLILMLAWLSGSYSQDGAKREISCLIMVLFQIFWNIC